MIGVIVAILLLLHGYYKWWQNSCFSDCACAAAPATAVSDDSSSPVNINVKAAEDLTTDTEGYPAGRSIIVLWRVSWLSIELIHNTQRWQCGLFGHQNALLSATVCLHNLPVAFQQRGAGQA